MLYKQHPSLVHSTLCVIIMPMISSRENAELSTTSSPGLMVGGHNGNLSWHDVEGLNRLCVRVRHYPFKKIKLKLMHVSVGSLLCTHRWNKACGNTCDHMLLL